MSHCFFDSSALVKRYIPEIGLGWVRHTLEPSSGNDILIASITRVEIVSALSRRVREASVLARTAKAVRLIMERHSNRQYSLIGLTEPIVKLSQDLLEMHPLRAYDAVQLASALESKKRLLAASLSGLIFVSSDKRLLLIANAEGLQIDDPNNHP